MLDRTDFGSGFVVGGVLEHWIGRTARQARRNVGPARRLTTSWLSR